MRGSADRPSSSVPIGQPAAGAERRGKIKFQDTESGLIIDLEDFHGVLPYGEAIVTCKAIITPDFETLDVMANLDLTNIPQEYVLELLYEMNDLDLLEANGLDLEEFTILNVSLGLSGVIELFPFALRSAQISQLYVSIRASRLAARQLPTAGCRAGFAGGASRARRMRQLPPSQGRGRRLLLTTCLRRACLRRADALALNCGRRRHKRVFPRCPRQKPL